MKKDRTEAVPSLLNKKISEIFEKTRVSSEKESATGFQKELKKKINKD